MTIKMIMGRDEVAAQRRSCFVWYIDRINAYWGMIIIHVFIVILHD